MEFREFRGNNAAGRRETDRQTGREGGDDRGK